MGIKLTSANTTVDNKNSHWNLFLNCSVWRAARGVVLTGESTVAANSAHNMFVGLNIGYYAEHSTNAGIWLGDCDNNCFIRGWIFPIPLSGNTSGPGVWIDDPDKARANYFYHLQPATGSQSNISFWVRNVDTTNPPNSKNLIFGYDLENGQGQPRAWSDGTEITSMSDIAKFLFWIDSKGKIRGGEVL